MNDPKFLLWILLGVVGLFALVIVFGLKARKRFLQENLKTTAREVWAPLAGSGGELSDLIYGIWQDASATQVEMLVRNCRDEPIGKITFGTPLSPPWIKIEINQTIFVAAVQWKAKRSVVLFPEGEPEKAICTLIDSAWQAQKFELPERGTIESVLSQRWRLAPIRDYILKGKLLGRRQDIGFYRPKGRSLVMSQEIPLEVRLFMMVV